MTRPTELEDTAAPDVEPTGPTNVGGPANDPEFFTRPPPSPSQPAGYRLGEMLGRGGMGEVLLAEELAIGRHVAIKRMRGAPTPDAIDRFLREAKIQARLDHPAVVPVHSLGRDADGAPFFTMKRLTGVTLHALLAEEGPTPLPQQRLLHAIIDVGMAVEFAHSRGVIHRDLKPANIMLGDYGEVYVLDWGVARMTDQPDDIAGPLTESLVGHTLAGAVLGTPGYMSPEQVRGEVVTPATDVYALGSILFEILAGDAVHPHGLDGLRSTLADTTELSPAKRQPARTIAPELDAACQAALRADPAQRPSARELADRIQRYLDGDRDVERRRQLAAEHLATARAAVESGDSARRGEAIAAAGRALALQPESAAAAALVTQLMIEPPRELPAPLAARLEEADLDTIAKQGKLASLAYLTYLLMVPLAIKVGVTSWATLIVAMAVASTCVVGALVTGRRRTYHILWAVYGNAILIGLFTRMFGTFVLVPGLAGAIAVALMTFPSLAARPLRVILPLLGGFVVPLALELAGLITKTWAIKGGSLVITPTALHFGDDWAIVFLVVANVALVVVMSLFAYILGVGSRTALHTLESQAWHLTQLIPLARPRDRA